MISVIFPVYNIKEDIVQFHKRLVATFSSLNEPFEIIAVDDGSTDDSRKRLLNLSPLTVVMLSRHFGYNAALDAGFRVAIGDLVITIDTDPNNYPEDIPLLVEKLRNGYGVAVGWRKFYYSSLQRKILSRTANWFIRAVTKVQLHDFSCPLKGYRREFIDGEHPLGETFIFMPVFAHHRGARVVEVDIAHQLQAEGVSRYRLRDRFYMFFDLLAVKFLLSYFARPLRFFGSWALFFGIMGAAAYVAAIVLRVSHLKNFTATSLPLIGTMLIILSVLVFMLGFVTEILLRIYYAQKDNAPYMIYEIAKNK